MSVKVMKERTTGLKQKAHKAPINFAETVESFVKAKRFCHVLEAVKNHPQLSPTGKNIIENIEVYFRFAVNFMVVSNRASRNHEMAAEKLSNIISQCSTWLLCSSEEIKTLFMEMFKFDGTPKWDDTAIKDLEFPETLQNVFDAYIDSIKGQVEGLAGTMDGKFSYDGFTYNGQNIRLNSGVLYIERLNNIGIVFDTVQEAEAFYEANKFPGCWLEQITDFHTSLKQIG